MSKFLFQFLGRVPIKGDRYGVNDTTVERVDLGIIFNRVVGSLVIRVVRILLIHKKIVRLVGAS